MSFEAAKLVFFDPFCLTQFDRVKDGEDRWHAIGLVNRVLLLLVIHSVHYEGRAEVIEIISVRRPHKS